MTAIDPVFYVVSFHMYEEYLYIVRFLWRIYVSTNESGQNQLGIKPKAEPGGSELDLIQLSIQAKKKF